MTDFVKIMKMRKAHFNKIKRQEQRQAKFHDTKSVIYDNYDRYLLNPQNFLDAFIRCNKTVSWKRSYQMFSMKVIQEIAVIVFHLFLHILGTMDHNDFGINERGTKREISAPDTFERIIQSVLCNKILHPLSDHAIIKDNFACQKGKGVKKARLTWKRFLTQYYKKHGKQGNVINIDLKKYFDSIVHDLAVEVWNRYTKDQGILDLIMQIFKKKIDHETNKPAEQGLCLGSELSQLTAIIFIVNVDHFAKEYLRAKFYGRYNDDMGFIESKNSRVPFILNSMIEQLKKRHLNVNLKKTKVRRLERSGIKMLKVHYIFDRHHKNRPNRVVMLSGKETCKRERRKIRKFHKRWIENEMSFADIVNCYKGWRGNVLKQFNAYRLISRHDELFKEKFGLKYANFRTGKYIFINRRLQIRNEIGFKTVN